MKISLVSIVYQQCRQSRLATATSSTQQYSYRFLPFSDSAMRKYYYRMTYQAEHIARYKSGSGYSLNEKENSVKPVLKT